MSDSIAGIDRHELLHHGNIPHLDDTVGVAGRHVLAADREDGVIDRVQVTVERLHGQARAHIPNGRSLVSRARHKEVGKRLEVKTIN